MPAKPDRPLFVDHLADYVEAWREALRPVKGNRFNTYAVTQASRRRLEKLAIYHQTRLVTISLREMTIAILQEEWKQSNDRRQPAASQPAPDAHLEAAYDDRFEL